MMSVESVDGMAIRTENSTFSYLLFNCVPAILVLAQLGDSFKFFSWVDVIKL
jgi:hypothetical protein